MTRKIHAVVILGKYLAREELDGMRAAVRGRPHIEEQGAMVEMA